MPSSPVTTPAGWRQAILEYIAAHPDKPQKARGLARALAIETGDYPDFRALVREMLNENVLVLGRARTLRLPTAEKASGKDGTLTFTGIFRAHRRGFGFIEVSDGDDVYVPRLRTHDALDGDVVEARLIRGRRAGDEARAEVIRIVSRAETNWVGPLEKRREGWIVEPIGRRPAPLVLIEDPTAKSARPGDLVVVEPIEQKLNPRLVRGVIVERLGAPNLAETKVRAVAARYGLPEAFEPEVLSEARAVIANFDPDNAPDRKDLRDLLTITIDPVDARDFDDAISIHATRDGWELGVHIADVAAFVTPGSELDAEARRRGNSTYFPGYVVPMLPEVLSNGICSLQPNQPRFCKSIFIDYDRRGRARGARFDNAVIESSARLTYEQASAVLDGQSDPTLTDEVVELLRQAEKLARAIRKRRVREGMISLNLPEVDIVRDEHGEVCGAVPADTSFSHTLIEMFMVEANEAVCRMFAAIGVPHLRRTHDDPDPEAVVRLGHQLVPLGIPVPTELNQHSMQDLLASVKGKPAEHAVNFVLLRCLAQATYSPGMIGHFALASRDYCHFTSPIRRYPDLIVHRLLDELRTGDNVNRFEANEAIPDTETLQQIGRECSASERLSQQAERDARQWLLLDFLQRFLGDTFDGLITGVSSIGAFVQIQPYLAEGLVRVEDFGPDHWDHNEESSTFVGRNSRQLICFGQPVRVQIASIDPFAQEMNLVPAEDAPFGRPLRTTDTSSARRTASSRKSTKKKSAKKSAKTSRKKTSTRKASRKKRR